MNAHRQIRWVFFWMWVVLITALLWTLSGVAQADDSGKLWYANCVDDTVTVVIEGDYEVGMMHYRTDLDEWWQELSVPVPEGATYADVWVELDGREEDKRVTCITTTTTTSPPTATSSTTSTTATPETTSTTSTTTTTPVPPTTETPAPPTTVPSMTAPPTILPVTGPTELLLGVLGVLAISAGYWLIRKTNVDL